MKINISKLEEVKNLRSVWPDEAKDFTNWLAEDDNISLLAEALGLEDIVVEGKEVHVDDFRLDILASEAEQGRKIVIENQLEDSNHDHLGKLITYAAGKSADIMVWIVKMAKDAHRAAIEWLNEHSDGKIGFFLCEIKLYRIGGSAPAVKFEVIEAPNNWSKDIMKSLTETQQRRYDYWEAFQKYAFRNKEFSQNFNPKKVPVDHWLNFSIGSSACNLSVLQIYKRNELEVQLWISDNKELFHALKNNKTEIEAETGLKFDWQEKPEKKASSITIAKKVHLEDRKEWEEQFQWAIDVLLRMKASFTKYLQ